LTFCSELEARPSIEAGTEKKEDEETRRFRLPAVPREVGM
jgi:hypothetical protein